jgi:phosphomannomutase
MKQEMAERTGCAFGGELSGHFYFRDNFNADSGAIAMATVLSAVAARGSRVSELIAPVRGTCSRARSTSRSRTRTRRSRRSARTLHRGGGRSTTSTASRSTASRRGLVGNIRKSNTEPLLRLNCEARDAELLAKVTEEISPLLGERVDH